LVDSLQGAAAPVKKSGFDGLLDAVFGHAQKCNMVGRKEEASVDSTGLDAGHRSTHYAHRSGQKRYQLRNWPKLTLACHNATHLLIDVLVSDGPTQDAPLLAPVLRGACRRLNIDRLLADAGYDAESNHTYARNQLGIRSTVICLNRRGGRRWAKTKYRRQMYRRFPKLKYRQRAQIESAIARFKRRLTSSLRGRSRSTQANEVHLRVLTHDLLLLAA
jgi:Transposase DDE domain